MTDKSMTYARIGECSNFGESHHIRLPAETVLLLAA